MADMEKRQDDRAVSDASVEQQTSRDSATIPEQEPPKKRKWWHGIKEPGHALQIVVAAMLAIAIGLAVTTSVDSVPDAARLIIGIPGTL